MNTSQQEEVIRICDRAKLELMALALSQAPAPEAAAVLPDWLTAEQIAERWQLRNRKGKLTTAGVLSWAKRDPAEFPLPHAYMGDLIRFPRLEADVWAREEAERRQARKNKTPGQQTDIVSDSKLRRTLTAA